MKKWLYLILILTNVALHSRSVIPLESESKVFKGLLTEKHATEVSVSFFENFRQGKSYTNDLERDLFETYSKFEFFGEPELVYDNKAPMYYSVPILDSEKYVLDYLVISPYTGKVLQFPHFKNSYKSTNCS